jgi:hypothetical protein
MSCSDEQRLQLVANVDELIAERRWVLLADDLEHLDGPSRKLVIAKLASATSVYFTVTPWMVDEVHELMRRNAYAANRVMLSLDDIDALAREAIARVVAKYMHIPYVDGSIKAEFDPWNGTEGTTALGVLAALKTISVPDDRKHLHFGYLLLQEILPRSGYPRLYLPPCPDELDVTAIWLLRAGRAAREEMRRYEPYHLYDQVRNTRQAVPLYANSLTDLLGDPLQQLFAMQVTMHWPYHPAVEFIFPIVEELLMTLDSYYFGYPTSFFDFLFPGNKSPVLQRVQQSIAYVPQLLSF